MVDPILIPAAQFLWSGLLPEPEGHKFSERGEGDALLEKRLELLPRLLPSSKALVTGIKAIRSSDADSSPDDGRSYGSPIGFAGLLTASVPDPCKPNALR